MIDYHNALIYLAIDSSATRSLVEDFLVMDHCNVTAFGRAVDLWEHFQIRPSRIIITDRGFNSEFGGLELIRNIRGLTLPYVYVVLLSSQCEPRDIQVGLDAGADDYLPKPHSLQQIRSRILVGLHSLAYRDSAKPVHAMNEIRTGKLAAS